MIGNSALRVTSDLELDAWLEPFELAAEDGSEPDLADFLPELSHSKYSAVLQELVRIDLEFAWARGDERHVEEYVERFPLLSEDNAALAAVALEEYRQRRAVGEDPDPAEYRRRFGIDLPLAHRPKSPSGPEWTGKHFPEIGEVVGPGYRIVSELGRGAIGRVYLAEQEDLANRKVAVKISSRLIGEAQTLARLQHTHIVPVYAVHRVGSYQLLVMPYLGGATLAGVLSSVRIGGSGRVTEQSILTAISVQKGKPSVADRTPSRPEPKSSPATAVMLADRVLEIGIALADGLAHAHERGILHRDIKPANILLTDDGEPMLLDFNLAADEWRPLGSIGGTPRYMAPEHLTSLTDPAAPIDARADIYSLGLVLHELLTGGLPFPERSGSWVETAPRMIEDRRQPVAIRHHSPAIASILQTCLQPDPARRYASAAEFRDDLARQRDHQPLKNAPEPLSLERARKWARRHPRLSSGTTIGIVAAVLLVIIAWVAYSMWRGKVELGARKARAEVGQARIQAQSLVFDPTGPNASFHQARERVFEALKAYDLPANEDWLNSRNVRRLPAEDVDPLRAEVAELLYWGAVATARLASREGNANDRAILYDEALLLNGRARSAYPASGPIQPIVDQRARLLDLAGRSAEAAAAREELGRASIPGAAGELLRAHEDIHAKRYKSAIITLEKLESNGPTSYAAWLWLGVARLRTHQYDRAADAFLTAAALKPDMPQALLHRGAALYSAGRFAAAIEALTRFIAKRPDDPSGYLNRALARLRLNDLIGTLADLAEAERLGGSPARVHGLREQAWRAKGDNKRAAESHRLLLTAKPIDENDWTIRGEAKLADDAAGALADFDAALELDPDHVPALRGKASCLSEKLNRPADAAVVLDRIVKLGAANMEDRAGYAVLLARLGRTADARTQARACLGTETPALPLYQAASALALTATSGVERSEVISVLRRVVQHNASWAREMPNDPDLLTVRQDKDFQALMAAARVIAAPGTTK